MSRRRTGTWVALGVCAGSLFGCGTAQLPPNPVKDPLVVSADAETQAAPEPERAAGPLVWTHSELLRTSLPVTQDELDDLQADSLYSASVHGRLVWLDLHGKSARDQLATVRGPVSITLRDLEPKLLKRIDDLAKRFPVAIYYAPIQRQAPPPDLRSSDEEAEVAQEDLSGLGSLRHVRAMRLSIDSGPDFPDLRRCTGLARLEVFAPGTGNEVFERLPPQLEELSVRGSLPTSGDGKLIARFRKLRRLALDNARETAIPDLAPLRQLEDLELADQLRDVDLSDLRALPNLRRFASTSPFSNAAIAFFAQAPKLRALDLRGSKIDDAAQLAQLTQLEELTPPLGLSSEAIAKLGALQNLKALVLTHSKITDGAMQQLARLNKLESLDLSFSQLSDASAPSFTKLTQLRHLDLSTSRVGDETARALVKLVHLRRLDLQGTGITNAAVPALLQLSALRVLHVNSTSLDSEGVLALLALPNLHRYYTSTSESDPETYQRILQTKRLIDSVVTDCDSRRIRKPQSECEDR